MHLGVVSSFPPDLSGIGQYGWHVTHGLAQLPNIRAVTVLAPHARAATLPPAPLPTHVQVQRIWRANDLATTPRLWQAIQAARPDVVWFNLGFTVFGQSRVVNFLGLTAPLLMRPLGCPVVVTLHEVFEAAPPHSVGASNGRLTAWGARTATQLVLQADAVCVTLQRYAQLLAGRYGAKHVQHVPHGIFTTPEFLPFPSEASPYTLLVFATFAPYKGLQVLLQAMQHVQAACPQATLLIAGSDHPRFPGHLAEVRAQAGALPGVQWLGALPEPQLRAAFAQARVVVLPYTATTGASSVLHRAAGGGRPVVASDLPDLRAVVEEENLHVNFVPPADPQALAAALLALLHDPARQTAQAQHNLAQMQAMTLERTCARYMEIFAQLLQRKQR